MTDTSSIHFSRARVGECDISVNFAGYGSNVSEVLASSLEKRHSLSCTLTGPAEALECLQATLPAGPAELALSPISRFFPTSMHAEAPEGAHSCAFLYALPALQGKKPADLLGPVHEAKSPLGSFKRKFSSLTSTESKERPWIALVTTGGFVYFDAAGQVMAVDALTFEPTEATADVTLVGPFAANREAGEALRAEGRLQAVGIPSLIAAGFIQFGFVSHGELLGGQHTLAGAGKSHDAFVYAHSDMASDFLYYQVAPADTCTLPPPLSSSSALQRKLAASMASMSQRREERLSRFEDTVHRASVRGDESEILVRNQLVDAHRKAATRRLRVTGSTVGIALVLLIIGLVVVGLYRNADAGIEFYLGVVCCMLSGYTMHVALLPTDRRVIRTISVLVLLVPFSILGRQLFYYTDPNEKLALCRTTTWSMNATQHLLGPNGRLCDAEHFLLLAEVIIHAPTLCVLLLQLQPTRGRSGKWRFKLMPRAVLNRLWTTAFIVLMAESIMRFAYFSVNLVSSSSTDELSPSYMSRSKIHGGYILAASCAFVALVSLPVFRRRVATNMNRIFGVDNVADSASAAATIAATLRGKDVNSVLNSALIAFRGILATSLELSDFTSNAAAHELHSKTRLAMIGEVDFFLSHSWSDSPALKWEALQAEIVRFETANARTPVLWFDRACLNQQSIQESLVHLPVHLAGSNHMLALVGPSYVTRLWCLMEIFVFVQMRPQDVLKIVPVVDHTSESFALIDGRKESLGGRSGRRPPTGALEPISRLENRFKRMDARVAGCSNANDREQILAIIESAYGDVRSFNLEVRQVLLKGKARRLSSLTGALSETSRRFKGVMSETSRRAMTETSRRRGRPRGSSTSEGAMMHVDKSLTQLSTTSHETIADEVEEEAGVLHA